MENLNSIVEELANEIYSFFSEARTNIDSFMSKMEIHLDKIDKVIEQFKLYHTDYVKTKLPYIIADARHYGDIEKYTRVQYLLDVTLKSISNYLHSLFIDQNNLKSKEKELLSISSGDGCASREYLLFNIQKGNELKKMIEDLENRFDKIVSLAGEIGFQVFDQKEYRYSYYRALYLISENEVYEHFLRIGIPEKFVYYKT